MGSLRLMGRPVQGAEGAAVRLEVGVEGGGGGDGGFEDDLVEAVGELVG